MLEETDGNIKLTPSYHGRGLSGVKEMLMGDVIHIFSGIEVCQFLGSLKVFPIICRALALKKIIKFYKACCFVYDEVKLLHNIPSVGLIQNSFLLIHCVLFSTSMLFLKSMCFQFCMVACTIFSIYTVYIFCAQVCVILI